ncbi:MAG: alpha/beta fold hydrolase [Flavobacteriales bacterium]
MKSTFTYNDLTLEYLVEGSGPETIVCLHGFGREAEDFIAFSSLLKPNQRIVSINLFAHGNSSFPQERISKKPLIAEEWRDVVGALMDSLGNPDFHLMGYSMGGRLAMVLVETMPERLRSLVLLAPDGLKRKWIYRFVSETKPGRMLYRYIIEKPTIVFRIVDLLRTLRILHQKIHRFVHVQLETRERRQLVYSAWLIHRNLFPDLQMVAHAIEKKAIPFKLIFGAYDYVIPSRDGRRLLRHFEKSRKSDLLPLGHRLINTTMIEYIEARNLWMPPTME